jgi:iron complex transport system ATP-binding protein
MTRTIDPAAPPLRVEDAWFHYPGREQPALRAFGLTVAPGEVVGLIGPNGAGKSTALRLAAGLLEPASGTVRVQGADPARLPRARAARLVALVPASLAVQFPMTVRDLVALGRTAHLQGLFESAEDRRAVADALAFASVEALAGRPYGELSAGEQRRVLVARAVAQSPRVLLLDEPTANLDVAHAVSLLRRVVAHARATRTAVVAAIHDLNLALLFCDRVVLMQAGGVVAQGEPEAVMQYGTVRATFGCDLYIGRNELNGRLYLVPIDGPGRD